VNAAHVIAVADLLERNGWDVVSPWQGPKQLCGWIAVLLAASENITLPDALTRVFALSLDTLLNTLNTE
jgi:hypothetical protein